MVIEFPLSGFCIIKLSFFDGDFNEASFSLVKFKGARFIYESNGEKALSLILDFQSCVF